jgi:hypothetical protein
VRSASIIATRPASASGTRIAGVNESSSVGLSTGTASTMSEGSRVRAAVGHRHDACAGAPGLPQQVERQPRIGAERAGQHQVLGAHRGEHATGSEHD